MLPCEKQACRQVFCVSRHQDLLQHGQKSNGTPLRGWAFHYYYYYYYSSVDEQQFLGQTWTWGSGVSGQCFLPQACVAGKSIILGLSLASDVSGACQAGLLGKPAAIGGF